MFTVLGNILRRFVLLSIFLILSCGLASADDEFSSPSLFSEFRIGSFVHDAWELESPVVLDLNAEILFAPLRPRNGDGFFDYFLSPRPHIGTTLSFTNDTSEYYMGVTWDIPLNDTFFIEASFGGVIHDGKDSKYGCRVNFRESASIGLELNDNWRLIATIDHMSNAELCGNNNRGLTNAGLSLGYKFN